LPARGPRLCYAAKLASAVAGSPRGYQPRDLKVFHARPDVAAARAARRQGAAGEKKRG